MLQSNEGDKVKEIQKQMEQQLRARIRERSKKAREVLNLGRHGQ